MVLSEQRPKRFQVYLRTKPPKMDQSLLKAHRRAITAHTPDTGHEPGGRAGRGGEKRGARVVAQRRLGTHEAMKGDFPGRQEWNQTQNSKKKWSPGFRDMAEPGQRQGL